MKSNKETVMKFQQIRNATVKIEFAGAKFLVDPMLAPKETYPGFEGTFNSHLRFPSVELPTTLEDILDVDAIIVTHTHLDHWDETAKQVIPKNQLIIAQNENDAKQIKSEGFTNVEVLTPEFIFKDVKLIKTDGQHGSDSAIEVLGEILGEVCGIIFKHHTEKVLYLAGDTVWNAFVKESIDTHQPEILILNSGDAQVPGLGSIIMSKEDVYEVHKAAPNAILIASHMEAVNHAALTRSELQEYVNEKGISDHVCIPQDGETYSI